MVTKKIEPKSEPKPEPSVDPKVDQEPDVEPEPKPEPTLEPKPEPDDNKERSELGRKVKALSESYEEVNAKLDAILELQSKPPVAEPDEDVDSDWVPTTKRELDEYFEKKIAAREAARMTTEKQYNDAYMNTIAAYKDHDDYEEICAKLDKDFNIRHSNDGKMDAEMNFLKAANAHYREKIHGKTNPLEKNKGEKLPLGAGGSDETLDKDEAVMPKLDKDAMAYIEATGKTAEEVIEIMKKPLPPTIGGIA